MIRFVENASGTHTCFDLDDVLSLGVNAQIGVRCAGLVPDGFFDRGKAT